MAEAQEIIERQSTDSATAVSVKRPTIKSIAVPLSDSLRAFAKEPASIESTSVAEPHSPNKALYLSILPGMGQIYNHQAWKVPIIYALMGGLSYWSYSCYGDMKMFRDEYLLRVNGGTPELKGYTGYANTSIYNLYLSNNQYFQLGIVLTVLVYGLNLLDAYVYGHLFDFQIDEDLSLSVAPSLMSVPCSPFGISPSMGLSLSF